MKRLLMVGGAFAAVVIALPMFSAFEAHVVNVTATIDNALSVQTQPIEFGGVFPEEVLHHPLAIALSPAFTAESNSNSNSVSYFIRQKPKCGVPVPQTNPVQYSQYVQVTDVGTGVDEHFACPMVDVRGPQDVATTSVQSVALPSLCPFLSKHSDVVTPATEVDPAVYEDGHIDSFHGTLPWTFADAINTTVTGVLTKITDPLDTWDIDLHVPCFKGECAQDNVVPVDYQLDPSLEHTQLGCDLWVEVSAIPTT